MRRWTPLPRLFACLGLLAVEGILCFVWEGCAFIWMCSLLGLLLALLWDVRCLWAAGLQAESHGWTPQPTVQQPFTARFTLLARQVAGLRLTVRAVESDLLMLDDPHARLEMEGERVIATWRVTPKARGALQWPGVLVSFQSGVALLRHWQTLPPVPVKVYPKLNRSLQSLLNPAILLEQLGVKTHRMKRADQVFESLRPYVLGDNYRHIDWKASARSSGLITRQFQVEQHHNILVCLDTSRLMGTVTDGVSKLDWAIEATLHLAYLASHLNDRIGLLVFSRDADQWVKPQKAPVAAFLNSMYDVQSRIVEADLSRVCAQVLATQKKRSLVIFLSDFIDASSMQPFLPAFGQLNRKHCSLFIGVEDPAYRRHLQGALPAGVATAFDFTRRVVAQDAMTRRESVLKQFRQLGLRAITTAPDALVQKAMAAYLEIKRQGAI